MKLFIGGINFEIEAHNRGPEIFRNAGAAYDTFQSPTPSPHPSIRIQVSMEWGEIPQAQPETLLFDSGQSWQIYRRNDTYRLFLHPKAFDSPIWMAEFQRWPEFIKVICREDLDSTPFRYPLDQLLSIYILAAHRGLLIHSAGVALQAGGILLAGKSGAGKSTITRQFPQEERMNILSDDRMIAREKEGGFLVHGTPWPGEEGIALNHYLPLKAILFLRHGSNNQIKPLAPQKALEKLMQTASITWYDKDFLNPTLDTCESLVSKIPCFDFFFTPDPGAGDYLKTFNF